MRKTKDDMLLTRELILKSAFNCFYEKGFEKSSLEEIAQQANLTRGAVYWHFADKYELYRAVVDMALELGDVTTFCKDMPADASMEDCFVELFWAALNDNPYVTFVFKTIAFTQGNDAFSDVFHKVRDIKLRLIRYFDERITRHIQAANIVCLDSFSYAMSLFYLFEGMFLTTNISLGIGISREEILKYIRIALHDLRSR